MVGLESSMDLAEEAKKTKKPEVSNAESKRQSSFLKQLRARRPAKIKAAAKPKARTRARKGRKMTRARKGETYYCTVCGCEIMCTASSKSPIVCCDEVMYIID